MQKLCWVCWSVLVGITPILGESTTNTQGKVIVHLFEWKWPDIAQECEQYLGPMGIDGVQISPPQEHIQGSPWWTRYQVVSYTLQGRSGNRAQFAEMVARCRKAHVKIYADAVINHMSAGEGVGTAGTNYRKWDYPNYSRQDFNQSCSIVDYQNRWQVQHCDLVGMADLDTGSAYVQGQIRNYLQDLVNLGVAGLRIDAAKHIPAQDLRQILAGLDPALFIYQEVIDLRNEPIRGTEYFATGAVTEFKFGELIANAFYRRQLERLNHFDPTALGLYPADRAVIFLDNHDSQRSHRQQQEVITFHDGQKYALAHVLMLGLDYGHVALMSSYRFYDNNQGPPNTNVYDAEGKVHCEGPWVCEHRWDLIAKMIRFRQMLALESPGNWWFNNNRLAFSRGQKSHVVINVTGDWLHERIYTALAAGNYRNIVNGKMVEVDRAGFAEYNIPPFDASVIMDHDLFGIFSPLPATIKVPTN